MIVCDICERKLAEAQVCKITVGTGSLETCTVCRDQVVRRCDDAIAGLRTKPEKTLTLNDDKAAVEAAAKRGYSS